MRASFVPNGFLSILAMLAAGAAQSAPLTIEFEDRPYGALPYTEDGLTFNAVSSGNGVGAGEVSSNIGWLSGGTNTIPIRVRVDGIATFDLLSLDIEQVFRTWTIESSSGAIHNVVGASTVDFSSQIGWSGISFFEIVHDPGEANGSIRIDDVRVNYVPEPSNLVHGLAASLSSILFLRKRVTQSRCAEHPRC